MKVLQVTALAMGLFCVLSSESVKIQRSPDFLQADLDLFVARDKATAGEMNAMVERYSHFKEALFY